MRKLISILAAVFITATVWAQSPQKMSFQTVIRDVNNKLVTNQKVGIRISILEVFANGKSIYTETQTPTTNANGLVSIEIGGGAGFDAINWGNGNYFLKTQTDPDGGTTYTITGTSQLLSVPFALHAKTAEGISGKISVSQISDLQSGITSSLLPPSATVQAVTNLQPTSATLNGTVNANNLNTTVSFEWGLTTSYGNVALAVPNFVTGTSDVAVSANLTGLQSATTYHYRIKAVNAVNVTYSGDMLFTNLVVDVKSTGAKGDGVTNDTKAIQTAIDQVGGTGGTVYIPNGTYMVDCFVSLCLKLKSNMTLQMQSSSAILKGIGTNNNNLNFVVFISGKNNVTVTGGTIIGERYLHTGTAGEFGMGIGVMDGSYNVTVKNVIAKDCWGDGFFTHYGCHDLIFDGVTGDNNRRQGLSVSGGYNIVIKNSTFKNTGGTDPQAGIDLEPDKGHTVNNVQILNCQTLNNAGYGILICSVNAPLDYITLDGCTETGNVQGPIGITANNEAHHVLIKNNNPSSKNGSYNWWNP